MFRRDSVCQYRMVYTSCFLIQQDDYQLSNFLIQDS